MEEDFFIIRPASGQRLPLGRRKIPDPRPDIFPTTPKVGLVISTFGAPQYVELALAVRQRLYPDTPTLVHDDASHRSADLSSLCSRYGVDFETTSSRLGHPMGDLCGIVGGLRWAEERGIDLLVKMSRRFIPLTNWVTGLTDLASTTQYPTYSNVCRHFGLPIRSECLAMAVGEWRSPEIEGEITRLMLHTSGRFMPEDFIANLAWKLDARKCTTGRKWTEGKFDYGFALWDLVCPSRVEKCRSHLWYSANGPEDYAGLARNLGLPIGIESFAADPNA
jgi:hypothetical protein